MLKGVGTSAFQIEGSCTNRDWDIWAEQGRIANSDSPNPACNSFEMWERDIEMIEELNANAYRLSLEWARIEPEEGKYSIKAIKYYESILIKLLEKKIEPILTLHHFAIPKWLYLKNGFENKNFPIYFENYTEFVMIYLSKHLKYVITINEPNVLVTNSYLYGDWPPGKKNIFNTFGVLKNILTAHVKGYNVIKKCKPEIQVSISHHVRLFAPSDKILDKMYAKILDYLFNELFISSMYTRRLLPPLGIWTKISEKVTMDFIGLNYYSKDDIIDLQIVVDKNSEKSDLGWAIHPEGLYYFLTKYHKKYKLPILIAENGIADENDIKREKYIKNHVEEAVKAKNEGVDVLGYIYWSLMDNFELAEGYRGKFGLYEVNNKDFTRNARKSAEYYRNLTL